MGMAAIVENQTLLCEICSKPAPSEHHILHVSLGGLDEDENLIRLCSSCHALSHPEKFGGNGIHIIKDDLGLLVTDKATEEVLLDKSEIPTWFHLQRWIARFRRLPKHLRIAQQVYFKYLPDDALVEIARVLDELDDENWLSKAKLLQVAKLRIPWGERKEKWDAAIQAFGVKKAQAYRLVQALDLWEQKYSSQLEICPTPEVLVLAQKQPEPERALDLWQDRRAENPRYSEAQFKEDLRRGSGSLDPAPTYHTVECDCGAVFRHPVRT